ncbi:MAG: 1-aminocyclopropane-1-carboxylate deaminase/D-cysteine desulfhydrase, partial [Cyclobacteriaceae bacterium]
MQRFVRYANAPLEEVPLPEAREAGVRVLVKREDLNHPYVSGNKWWKLKYNLQEAVDQGHHTLLTFGGAYSNHLYATAAAARELGLNAIGIIRGEEVLPLNPTLAFAQANGMKLHFISRARYRDNAEDEFIRELHDLFGDFYLIPE